MKKLTDEFLSSIRPHLRALVLNLSIDGLESRFWDTKSIQTHCDLYTGCNQSEGK